jgi:crotonobetainyl-CoA:carnitine CoA-transferase CaiB-like acyl-CoA transferase
MGPLDGLRVLDLTDDFGLACGKLLADLGADVLQIEPPGGARARRRGPFARGVTAPESSLHWWAYSRGKRSQVLSLKNAQDREALLALVEEVDVWIDSARPGALERVDLTPARLTERNPALVRATITPYGTTGPKARWTGTDLTLWAAGGPLLIQGDEDRPPVRISVPQAEQHAAVDAAVGILIALEGRTRDGLGQHVDVSIQQSATAATQSGLLSHHAGDSALQRMAGGSRNGPLRTQFLYPAKDGYVSITHVFGSGIGPLIRKLMEYIHDEGGCDAATRDKDWLRYLELLLSGEEPFEEFERVKRVIAAFTGSRTVAELERAAQEHGLVMAPIRGVDAVVENEHLRAREYWHDVEHPELDRSIPYPGPFARFSRTPIHSRPRAPELDERRAAHPGMERRFPPRNAAAQTPPASIAPLEGIRIVDLSWVIAGPRITRMLCDFGAEVVRIESTTRTDTARTLRPFPNGEPGKSVLFHSLNVGKSMMTLDLRNDAGRRVFLDLVRWADVVVESFSPKAMKSWGLGYESLSKVNPGLVMLSSSLMGQTGPQAGFGGFGNLAAAVTGFHDLTGWPDRAPAGPWGAYTDYVTPRHGAIALLAALEHRRTTGEGQHIDLSQAEAALHFLGPALLDFTVNGDVPTRAGNLDPQMAPHGVYPAQGEDRWVAIAVEHDEEWEALCEIIGAPQLGRDPLYGTVERRLARVKEIETLLSAWTRARDMHDIERTLQARGVPASALRGPAELSEDPQLIARDHFIQVDDGAGGQTVIEGNYFRLSRTPARPDGGYPELGRDSQRVLEEVLRYDDDQITQLVLAGALG